MIKVKNYEVSEITSAYYLGNVIDGCIGCVCISKEVARGELGKAHGFMQHLTHEEVKAIEAQGVVFEGSCPSLEITAKQYSERVANLCNENVVEVEKVDNAPFQKGDDLGY